MWKSPSEYLTAERGRCGGVGIKFNDVYLLNQPLALDLVLVDPLIKNSYPDLQT